MNKAADSASGGQFRRFMTKINTLASLPYVFVGLLLIVIIFSGGRAIEHHIGSIETWIIELGPWGIFAFIGIFALATSLFLPESMLCIIAGVLFGVGRAFPAVVIASLLAGAIQYALARKLLRLRIQRKLATKPSLKLIQNAVLRDEFRLQLLLRLTPLNPATISYLLGSRRTYRTRLANTQSRAAIPSCQINSLPEGSRTSHPRALRVVFLTVDKIP